MSVTNCPVFRPSVEEFQDFYKYVERIEQQYSLGDVGIIKIIPPPGSINVDYVTTRTNLVIDNPVRQAVSGRIGIYNVDLLEIPAMKYSDFESYDLLHNSSHIQDLSDRERAFWKSLSSPGTTDPVYGADTPGTIFGDNQCTWNINKLDNVLRLLPSIPGVNAAMLYVGTWRAMFAYHVEDLCLYSINYLHFGERKSWYAIPPKYQQQFESLAQSHYPLEYRKCKEYLRHKSKLFSPSFLKEKGISFHTVVQEPGEFVITFPGSYHAGFNHGINLAESTNFATMKWLDIGRRCHPCVCRPNAVSISIDLLETLLMRQAAAVGGSPYVQSDSHKKQMVCGIARVKCVCGVYRLASADHRNKSKAQISRKHKNPHNVSKAMSIIVTEDAEAVGEDVAEKVADTLTLDNHSDMALGSCSLCHMKCHLSCQQLQPLSSPFICLMCRAIEQEDISNLHCGTQTLPMSVPVLPLPVTVTAAANTVSVSALATTTSSDSKVKRRKIDSSSLPALCKNSLKIGSRVCSVEGQSGPEAAVVGAAVLAGVAVTVTDKEDSLCRLHVKGARREQDVWMDELLLTAVAEDDTCAATSSATASSSSKCTQSSSASACLENSRPKRGSYVCSRCNLPKKGHTCPAGAVALSPPPHALPGDMAQ